jgi:hypothetical protein
MNAPGRLSQSLVRLRNELSERDLAILQSVSDLRFVTGRQLQVMHFDGAHQTAAAAARSCRRVLGRLSDLQVLRRLERQVGGVRAGSAAFVYGVGPAGFRLIDESRSRQGFREPSMTFLDHSLATSEVLTTVVGATKADGLQLVRYETEPGCWREIPGYGTGETLRPDLMVVVARGDTEWHWWVEVDLATEHLPSIVRKCRQYVRYWQSGIEQSRTQVFPRVAWLTTTPKRSSAMKQAISDVDGGIGLFEVGLLDRPLDVLVPERSDA